MAGIDFNRLNGPQRKVVRETLMSVFRNQAPFDRFLAESQDEYPAVSYYPGNYTDQVFEFVGDLIARGHLGRLIEEVKDTHPDAPDLVDLDDRLRLVSDAAQSSSGAEARGGLERITRSSRFQNLHLWTKVMAERASATCRLRLVDGAEVTNGSGFLIAPDLVLTNHHVVEAALVRPELLATLDCAFGYAETKDGLNPGTSVAVAEIVTSRPYSKADLATDGGLPGESELDYAVLRLATPAPGDPIPVALSAVPPRPGVGDIIYLLQHPFGQPLKFTVGTVLDGPTPLRLRHDANSLGGSSGGLVLTAELQPVGMHHAGDPDAITSAYNQAIPLDLVAVVLRTEGVVA